MNCNRIDSLFCLSGKSAIVTGAGSGIGLEIARLLSAAGAMIYVADRNVEAGEAAATIIASEGGSAQFHEMDISDSQSVALAFRRIAEGGGELDILVNNAAIFPKYVTLEITADQWDDLHAVTLRGTMLVSQAAVRMMQAQGRGGRIVNISSCSSLRTLVHDNVAYAAAKAGVNMLTKTYALEFAPDNITVNGILPGGVSTPGARAVTTSRTISGPITGPGRVPLGRPANPEEIAAAVLYLVSPGAAIVTGQLLAVDGGFLMS